MPLLLRPSAPSPSVEELSFVVTAAPLSSQTKTSTQRLVSEVPRCITHSRESIHSRHRGSTASTDTEFAGCDDDDDAVNDSEHARLSRRHSHRSLHHSKGVGSKGVVTTCKDNDFGETKHSPHDGQLSDEHISSHGSFASEAERLSSLMSCSCSCADANEFGITSSAVVIEDQQLAVVDKELRDFRTTLLHKLYSRLTKITKHGRRKSTTVKPAL